MVVFRRLLGDVLRNKRLQRGMTLREVSAEARVSLGYISEIERGHKEASSELLASLCAALDVPLSEVLRDVSSLVAIEETPRLSEVPSGPATPVVLSAYVAPSRRRAPSAIARAHSDETTPYLSTSSTGTPSRSCFTVVA